MNNDDISQNNLQNGTEKGKPEESKKKAGTKKEKPEISEKRAEYLQEESKKYIRVGTDYYRLIHFITARKQSYPVHIPWNKASITQDHGKEIHWIIKKHVAFVNIPDNTETYRREHSFKGDTYYNLYEQLKHVPTPGDFTNTEKFLSRLFGTHYDFILDYLKILYENPTQNLPVVCLVSKAQGTGKSQFLTWVCQIFGRNAIILGNEEFSTNFNSLFASKLVICIDESFIDKILIKEKIKRMTTSDTINMEAKGRDSVKMDFFGKMILTSNTEDNFMKMDEEDNRFFVLKAPVIKEEEKIPDLPDKLAAEIPAFLYFLKDRQLVHPKKSRLWFDPKVYETEALTKIRKNTQGIVQKELLRWFEDVFAFEIKGDMLEVTPIRLARELEKSLKQVTGLPSAIARILKDEWQLPQSKNGKFTFYYTVDQYDESEREMVSQLKYIKDTGTFYTVTREFVASKTNS